MMHPYCSVKIEVVLFDRRDEPLSAADASKMLEEMGAQEQLQQETGLPVEINAPPPDQGGVNTAGTLCMCIAGRPLLHCVACIDEAQF